MIALARRLPQAITALDEIPKRQRLPLLIGFHGMKLKQANNSPLSGIPPMQKTTGSGTSLMDSVKEAADSFLVEAAKEGIWRVRGCGVSHAPSLFMAGQQHQRVKREI